MSIVLTMIITPNSVIANNTRSPNASLMKIKLSPDDTSSSTESSSNSGDKEVNTYREASENVLSTIASPDSVTVGDSITLNIRLKIPKDAQVIPPETDKGRIGDFVVMSTHNETKPGKAVYDTAIFRYHLSIFKPENCTIPNLEFMVGADSLWDTLVTPAVPIKVASVIPPDTPDSMMTIRDLKDQQKAGRASLQSLWLLLIVAAAIIIYYYLERRAKRHATSGIPVVPLKPAYEEALDLLSELLGKKYLEQGKIKEHVFELSEIFKRYIGRRYDTIAPELTTEEIVAWLEYSGINRETRLSAEWFFRESDQVKFAKWVPDSKVLNRFMKEVRAFLEATKPQLETSVDANAKTQKIEAVR